MLCSNKMDIAAGFKFSLEYDRGASSPLYCLLSQLTGYFSWQLKTEASHDFSTVVILILTLQITVLADNTHDFQDLVNSISDHAGMLGPSVNAKKTKNKLTGHFSQPCRDILVNQQKNENVEEFIYLGSSVHYQGDMDHEIK